MSKKPQRRAAEAMRERAWANARRRLAYLKEQAAAAHGKDHRIDACGWSFILTCNHEHEKAPDGSDWWHFSAKLAPHGRVSCEHDWHFLGLAVSAVGAPSEPITPLAETHPNAVHHWSWTSSGYDVAEMMRRGLRTLHPDLSVEPNLVEHYRAIERAIAHGLGAGAPAARLAGWEKEKASAWERMTEPERAEVKAPRVSADGQT